MGCNDFIYSRGTAEVTFRTPSALVHSVGEYCEIYWLSTIIFLISSSYVKIYKPGLKVHVGREERSWFLVQKQSAQQPTEQ